MKVNWAKVREFVHQRTLFATAAVSTSDGVRLFPIGSLRIKEDGTATYFEIFARPVPEGSSITFLAVTINPVFWIRSLLSGRFAYPPALRLEGSVGPQRMATEEERQGWFRKMKWLLKTPGGKLLWSNPKTLRTLMFSRAEPVRVGQMSRHLADWCHAL